MNRDDGRMSSVAICQSRQSAQVMITENPFTKLIRSSIKTCNESDQLNAQGMKDDPSD